MIDYHFPKSAVMEELYSLDGSCVGSLEKVNERNFVTDWESVKGAELNPHPALGRGTWYTLWVSYPAKHTIIVHSFLRDGFACWQKIRSLWVTGRGSQMRLGLGLPGRGARVCSGSHHEDLLCHRWSLTALDR